MFGLSVLVGLFCFFCMFFFEVDVDHRELSVRTHSFPTRRSSDLALPVSSRVVAATTCVRYWRVRTPAWPPFSLWRKRSTTRTIAPERNIASAMERCTLPPRRVLYVTAAQLFPQKRG